MPQVLYRKYRSQSFAELFGQAPIKQVLRQAVKENKVAHAYLFTGPRGTGKTSTARILAKAINCLEPKDGEPCNNCLNCLAVNEGKFLDLIEIDAASNRGIDEIRELKEKINFLPAEGKSKIYIIDEVHMLTAEAFNALLKTLEEPPSQVVFILATTEAHKLPLTIISRTQRFDFKLANNEELTQKLATILKAEGIEFSDSALALIVEAGQGSFRDAETILEKVLSSYGYQKDKLIDQKDVEIVLGYASSEIVNKLFEAILNEDRSEALKMVAQSADMGINLQQLVKQILELSRVKMLDAVSNKGGDHTIEKIMNIIRQLLTANEELKFSPITALPLEVAVVKLTSPSSAPESRVMKSVAPVSKSVVVNVESKTVAKKDESQSSQMTEEREETGTSGVTDLQSVRSAWPSILEKAKVFNHHMAAFLSQASIKDLVENRLILEVPFVFHKKRLELKLTQDAFNKITVEILGVRVFLSCEVNENLKTNKKEPEDASNKDLVEAVFGE